MERVKSHPAIQVGHYKSRSMTANIFFNNLSKEILSYEIYAIEFPRHIGSWWNCIDALYFFKK